MIGYLNSNTSRVYEDCEMFTSFLLIIYFAEACEKCCQRERHYSLIDESVGVTVHKY